MAKQATDIDFFMNIFLISAWEPWKLQNAIIFDAEQGSLQLWIRRFREQIHLQSWQIREDTHFLFIQCLETVL